jgi:hypothetical protein
MLPALNKFLAALHGAPIIGPDHCLPVANTYSLYCIRDYKIDDILLNYIN